MPDSSQSKVYVNDDAANSAPMMEVGASSDVDGVSPADPTWRLITVSVSAQAAKNGSQYPLWIEGRPSLWGASEKLTHLKPRAAFRRISSAATTGSRR